MASIGNVGLLSGPNTVSIFAQSPGIGFVAFALALQPIPVAGRVRLDLAETEGFTQSYDIARHPTERVVAQTKIRNPDELVLTGLLSANPLLSPLAKVGIARLDKREAAKLRSLIDRVDPLYIVTPERAYKNMMCTTYKEDYDETTPDAIRLTMTFTEIRIVSPGLVESVLDLDVLDLGTGGETDLGNQTPANFPDPGGLG